MTITSRGVSFTILVHFYPDCTIWDSFLAGLSADFARHGLYFVALLMNASKWPWGRSATEPQSTDCVGVSPSLYECWCLCRECGYQLLVCEPLPSRGRRADPAIDWGHPWSAPWLVLTTCPICSPHKHNWWLPNTRGLFMNCVTWGQGRFVKLSSLGHC